MIVLEAMTPELSQPRCRVVSHKSGRPHVGGDLQQHRSLIAGTVAKRLEFVADGVGNDGFAVDHVVGHGVCPLESVGATMTGRVAYFKEAMIVLMCEGLS